MAALREELPQEMELIHPAGPQPSQNDRAQSKIHIHIHTTVPQDEQQVTVTQICRGTLLYIYTDGSATKSTGNGRAGVLKKTD